MAEKPNRLTPTDVGNLDLLIKEGRSGDVSFLWGTRAISVLKRAGMDLQQFLLGNSSERLRILEALRSSLDTTKTLPSVAHTKKRTRVRLQSTESIRRTTKPRPQSENHTASSRYTDRLGAAIAYSAKQDYLRKMSRGWVLDVGAPAGHLEAATHILKSLGLYPEIMTAGAYPLNGEYRTVGRFKCAIILWTPRGLDNADYMTSLYQIGYIVGRLGRNRVILVIPEQEDASILHGLRSVAFDERGDWVEVVRHMVGQMV